MGAPIDRNDNIQPKIALNPVLPQDIGTDFTFKRQIVWGNAMGFLFMHLCALYGFYRIGHANLYTAYWGLFLGIWGSIGVTFGAHRLYSHKALKATLPVRATLLILQTLAGQNCMWVWVRDHRQHHKYSDTDADPHNASRGFFFSHIGWLMSRKHPLVIAKGKDIDMSDLEADSLVMFQKKYYKTLYIIFAIIIPVSVPIYFWGETLYNSVFISYFARYVLQLNGTWLINSATHLYGMKPYDKGILPVENNLVSFLALGEGFHNYHHSFPYDYRAGEYGLKYSFTTMVIDIVAALGLVYDLREARKESVERKILKKGDGSHPRIGNNTKGVVDEEDPFFKSVLEEQSRSQSDANARHITAKG